MKEILNNYWFKRISLFLVLAVLYTLLPQDIKSLIGSFAVGWMLVDIVGKVLD